MTSLTKNVKNVYLELDLDLDLLYRDFNGLMRSFFHNNILEKISNRESNNLLVSGSKSENHFNNSKIVKLTKKKTKKKKKKKKKKRIVWNAWVIDSSSESE